MPIRVIDMNLAKVNCVEIEVAIMKALISDET